MSTEQQGTPRGIDVSTPSSARMYDYYLGGKDNYPADREAAEQVRQVVPEVADLAWANRRFLRRAVRYLVRDAGVRQIIDIGTGVPTSPNVHEIAESIDPGVRIAYVDNDPIALTHARALLAAGGSDPAVAVIDGDLRDPRGIISDPQLTKHIDLTQPVAILLVSMLHFASDEDDPEGIVAEFRAAMAPGSWLGFTHATTDVSADVVSRLEEIYAKSTSPVRLRPLDRVRRVVDGFDFVEPGIVPVDNWCPDPEQTQWPGTWLVAGVGKLS